MDILTKYFLVTGDHVLARHVQTLLLSMYGELELIAFIHNIQLFISALCTFTCVPAAMAVLDKRPYSLQL